MSLFQQARRIGSLFEKTGMTFSVCESCTGGMLGSSITRTPGSSRYFLGGIIAYDNSVKNRVVGVPFSLINTFGAVSAEVAESMAESTRARLKSDVCVSITGIAGPGGGSKGKPVGLVFICLAKGAFRQTKRYRFSGNRETIRTKACAAAFELLINMLEKSL